ncbi:MAG: polysaccharide biosynthesis/export family protein [Gammaproteobacteria bacterium]|nr:polysaccharide biosynthesis/export family protein [Gammaproteobacteria bacterium]NNF62551.1 polysaccharide export protein [Gammaproteobacteria bacterium]NNM20746.1 polysaccharide export protein [Gammaproteobacteria bacterium]
MRTLITPVALLLLFFSGAAAAQDNSDGYGLNAGDILQVSIWREPELSREVLVRPDGKINFPLVGHVSAAGRTPEDVQAELVERLEQYIPDAEATVAIINVAGNKIYVLGKVLRPGEFTATSSIDVMQALAMAGGLNQFAAGNKIKVLRRDADGRQRAINFRYSDVEDGRNLQNNIILKSGDVVIVP